MHLSERVGNLFDINTAFGTEKNTFIVFGNCTDIADQSVSFKDSLLATFVTFSSCFQGLVFTEVRLPFHDIVASLTHFVKWDVCYLG